MADATKELSRGTQLAIGIVLLWFGGLLLYVAFMSGKTAQLTDSTDTSGTAHGPSDISGLLASVANTVQAAQITPTTGQALGTAVGQAAAANSNQLGGPVG